MLLMSLTNLGLVLECPASAEINVVPLNTLHMLHTGIVRMVSSLTCSLQNWFGITDNVSNSRGNRVLWLTIATTRFRWEAEFMQQVLMAHDLSARLIDLGIEPYMGQGSSAALQVHAEDEQAALLLLGALDGETEAFK
jgi:hypothetical protein